MEWLIVPAPIPAAVEFGVGNIIGVIALLLVALAPVLLVVLDALGTGREPAEEAPPLRVIEGGKEPGRRAA
jgi:hypothetical protein